MAQQSHHDSFAVDKQFYSTISLSYLGHSAQWLGGYEPVAKSSTLKEQKAQRASDNFCKSTVENHIEIEWFYPGSNRRLSD